MSKLFQWVADNQEWFLSGLGVFILSSAIKGNAMVKGKPMGFKTFLDLPNGVPYRP
ncbi:MAG: hypothetical protein HC910_17705 [Spirulinaceae cyanobacterium SM2_1_0]|nr:hypothetical protein [Spirulinaceae cyanobacterium SM2_1_0]